MDALQFIIIILLSVFIITYKTIIREISENIVISSIMMKLPIWKDYRNQPLMWRLEKLSEYVIAPSKILRKEWRLKLGYSSGQTHYLGLQS